MSLSLLLVVGEPAILQAGPCEDCETTKTIELAACDTDQERDEDNCIVDAETQQKIVANNEGAAIAKAQVDRNSNKSIADSTFSFASAACLAAKSPACLGTVTAAYAAALGKIKLDYESALAKAKIQGDAEEKNWEATLEGCRTKKLNNFKRCVQKANNKYADCKKKCGGKDGGG